MKADEAARKGRRAVDGLAVRSVSMKCNGEAYA